MGAKGIQVWRGHVVLGWNGRCREEQEPCLSNRQKTVFKVHHSSVHRLFFSLWCHRMVPCYEAFQWHQENNTGHLRGNVWKGSGATRGSWFLPSWRWVFVWATWVHCRHHASHALLSFFVFPQHFDTPCDHRFQAEPSLKRTRLWQPLHRRLRMSFSRASLFLRWKRFKRMSPNIPPKWLHVCRSASRRCKIVWRHLRLYVHETTSKKWNLNQSCTSCTVFIGTCFSVRVNWEGSDVCVCAKGLSKD